MGRRKGNGNFPSNSYYNPDIVICLMCQGKTDICRLYRFCENDTSIIPSSRDSVKVRLNWTMFVRFFEYFHLSLYIFFKDLQKIFFSLFMAS